MMTVAPIHGITVTTRSFAVRTIAVIHVGRISAVSSVAMLAVGIAAVALFAKCNAQCSKKAMCSDEGKNNNSIKDKSIHVSLTSKDHWRPKYM